MSTLFSIAVCAIEINIIKDIGKKKELHLVYKLKCSNIESDLSIVS